MHACGLRFGCLAFRAEADAPSHLRWLVDCLGPAFVEDDVADEGALRVRLAHDPGRHRDLIARGPAPDGGCPPCFLLDSQVVRYPLWNGPRGARTIHDTEYRVFYVVDGEGVDIVADGSSQWSRVALFRVVREIVLAKGADGTLPLHAAAAAVGPRGVLLAGPKRAGKTSLLIHLLGHPHARLVANDRVAVRDEDAPASFVGIPTIVKVRNGTLSLFQDRLEPCDRHADLACRRSGEPPRESELTRGLLLNPAQLACLVGRDRAAEASLDAIVFPRVTGTAEISLRSLSPEQAAPQLAASLFGAGVGDAEGSVLAPDPKVSTATFPERCVRLAERMRCLECHMGPDALRLADTVWSCDDPNCLWLALLHAPEVLTRQLPAETFRDPDLIWHQEHFGLPGHVAFATLALDGPDLRVITMASDLVQRQARCPELRTRIHSLFRGWAGMLFNGVLAFAHDHGVRRVLVAPSDRVLPNTDTSRQVDGSLFRRVYDAIPATYHAQRRADAWVVDVTAVADRIVMPLSGKHAAGPERSICLCHDIERGLGHEDIDAELAARLDGRAASALPAILAAEAHADVQATYHVVGSLIEEIRGPIEAAGGLPPAGIPPAAVAPDLRGERLQSCHP